MSTLPAITVHPDDASRRLADLGEERELFRSIFEQQHQLCGIVALDGTLLIANACALDYIGATAAEVIGRPFWETRWWAHSPVLVAKLRDAIARAKVGETVHFAAEHPRPDGTMGPVDFSMRPVFNKDGVITFLIPESVDVTAQRAAEAQKQRAEALLRGREARLQRLVDTTQDAVIFINAKAEIQRFNPAAEKMFGFEASEVMGKKVEMLMPESRAREHDDYIRRYERTGEPRAIGRIRTVTAQRKNGDGFPIELSVTKLGDDEDVRYAAFIRDITEQSRLQAQLLDNERLAAVGTMASMFAHEVGNPLNNMYLHTQLLERQLRKAEVTDSCDALELIKAEVRRLSRLLEDFRSFYRRDRLELGPTDLRRCLESVVRIHVQPITRSGLRIVEDLHDDVPLVHGNADKLQQVFINLCKNAVEAMLEGGTLTVSARVVGGSAVVEISDTGPGLPQGVDVFEAFRTTKERGTGLGLPIVRQIVTAHGGTVELSNRPDGGTQAVVVLPVSQ